MSGVARRFGRLAIQAVEHPEQVDRSALLEAASALLDISPAGEPEGMSLAVTMALRACDFCVLDRPDDHARLTRAVHAFGMYSVIHNY